MRSIIGRDCPTCNGDGFILDEVGAAQIVSLEDLQEAKYQTTPIKFRVTGWVEATEDDAEMWSNSHYHYAKGYGWGWFPAYEHYGPHGNRMRYMYSTCKEAEAKLAEYVLKQQ
jgi:hypothetical protein